MGKVIEATGDGACLFNALAIGLGIEIKSGRLDSKKDTPGYQQLLIEFAQHHPQFNPQTWDTLKQWLNHYNNSRDWELILAPVLFKFNQRYQANLEQEILNELTNFVRDNKQLIVGQVAAYALDYSKCPKIDNLNFKDKQKLIADLVPLIRDWDHTQDFSTIKSLVRHQASAQLDFVMQLIQADPNAFQRGYGCHDLKEMADALSLSLIENELEHPSDEVTQISLQNREQHWNVVCNDSDFDPQVEFGPQKLDMTSLQAFQGAKPVEAPANLHAIPDSQDYSEAVHFSAKEVDNPGSGDCAFYAFAIGLINIIQEENSYKNMRMFERLVAFDESLLDQFDAIIRFDFDAPNKGLLTQLQMTLRLLDYHYRLNELKVACAKPEQDYAQLVANSNFINFAALYYRNSQDIDPRYNEFANSAAVKRAVAAIDRSKVRENYEHLTLIPLFLSLMYGTHVKPDSITKETLPSADSPIILSMSYITREAYWGTHLDMDYLARAFEVNLHIYRNAQPIQEFHDVPERHTITLINQRNAHWVTELTRARITNIVNAVRVPSDLTSVNQPTRPGSNPKVGTQNSVPPVTQNELPPSPALVESDDNKLVRLKQFVANATIAYTDYSERNCYFSFFHRHGSSGRARAFQFNTEFAKVGTYTDAKRLLVHYLKDNKNGNTYAHSYRTMLLKELQMDGPKPSLERTSKQFKSMLQGFITSLNLPDPAVMNRK